MGWFVMFDIINRFSLMGGDSSVSLMFMIISIVKWVMLMFILWIIGVIIGKIIKMIVMFFRNIFISNR